MVHKENPKAEKSKLVKTLLSIVKKQFTKAEPEIPRYIRLSGKELFATANSLGKRIEVPVVSDYHGGQTSVIGRLMSMSYDSFENRSTVTINGPHFTAVVNIRPDTDVTVYL